METEGLWMLFWQTGRPEVWLAIRAIEQERRGREQAIPAFRERSSEPMQI